MISDEKWASMAAQLGIDEGELRQMAAKMDEMMGPPPPNHYCDPDGNPITLGEHTWLLQTDARLCLSENDQFQVVTIWTGMPWAGFVFETFIVNRADGHQVDRYTWRTKDEALKGHQRAARAFQVI